MRFIYSFLFYLVLPLVLLRLWWRSRRLPDYRHRIGERFGCLPFSLRECLWIHAVSVGESLAAVPLIKALQARYPAWPILVTSMTPTGAARIKASFGDTVKQVYIPYDLPDAVNRFLNAVNPVAGIIMETELWPNLLAACHQRHVPLCLANARLSEKSATGYRRIASLTREMLQSINVIAAHGEADAARFIALGAPKEKVVVTGNIKFDIELPHDLSVKGDVLREQLGGHDRFVWIAASTHEGEEEMVLAVHRQLREKNPQALLVLVPRHPDRFDTVAKLCEQSFSVKRRSRQDVCTQETGVYLGDTMGELLLMYAASDVAFVGGSLVPRGGHNMLEPAALGKPIITGPHLFNFKEISELFIAAGAMTRVENEGMLAAELILLMQDANARSQRGESAIQVMTANRGALSKQCDLISRMIGK